MIDSFRDYVGSVTVALVALISVGACVWQVTHGHEVDAFLSGLAGSAVFTLVPSPGGRRTQNVNVVNPPEDPVPVDPDAGQVGLDTVLVAVAAAIVVYALWAILA